MNRLARWIRQKHRNRILRQKLRTVSQRVEEGQW